MSAVFSNLLRNSAASIEQNGSGTIQVTTEDRQSEVVMKVLDDGKGIPQEKLAHLFDPAFHVEGSRISTTNWGLFISRSIITEHGGQIEIASVEGKGTTATISLPVPNR
jgi:signal transduction histidine kinase